MSGGLLWRHFDDLCDYGWIGALALAAGLVFGLAVHWSVGLGVGLGFVALCIGVHRLGWRVIQRSRNTPIPQRRFPGGRP